MQTYDTPYDRAKGLLTEVQDFALVKSHPLPTTRYAQIGDIVRDCESVIVAVGNISPDPLYDPVYCVSPRSSTFLVEILRNCAVVFNNDGTTNPVSLTEVSETASSDGQFLYEFAETIDGWSNKQPWSVAWSLAEANLMVSSLQITIGIP